jgi:polyvinyl alcohol dehydrogenase (cytochrome)
MIRPLQLSMLMAIGSISSPALADRPAPEIYATICSVCHEGGVPRAPHKVDFEMLGPRAILDALQSGVMQGQGALLTPGERRAIAEYLGQSALPAEGPVRVAQCGAAHSRFDFNAPPRLAGWGMDLESTRFISKKDAGLDASSVPKLKLKWAFGFPGATRARSQPTAGGGALYVGSQDGTVYALDFATGCVRWMFKAKSEVRSSPTLETWTAGNSRSKPRLWFGDFNGSAYAVDAISGQLLWTAPIDDQPRLSVTGSPKYYNGRLYVPMSSNEWASAANPSYECCKFRGGVVALDANDGHLLWRSYTIPQAPQATGELNSAGAKRFHPAGAPVWNSPTIDVRRKRLYVGTGEAYTSPAAAQSDAVIAYDLDTGKMLWSYQSIEHDAWNMACFIGGGPNCPVENGPDLDIGASTILYRLNNGHEVVLVGEKSGDVFALNPDDGQKLWRVKPGRGGFNGGVHWGMAATRLALYAPISDTIILGTEKGEPKPGLFALNPESGATKWYAPAPDVCPANRKPACDRGFSAPPTAIPGVVFQPSYD